MTSAKAPTTIHRAQAKRDLPNLMRLASARQSGVNKGFVDPFYAEARTSDGVLLFDLRRIPDSPCNSDRCAGRTMLVTRIR